MKKTRTGYRITKIGKVLLTIEKDAVVKREFKGKVIKEEGVYCFFDRKQGAEFIYLP